MNVTVKDGELYRTVEVRLSRRNLKTLLLKLDEPSSVNTLIRHVEGGLFLIVIGEDDDTHYGDREPGPMHPREEEKL